MKPKQRGLLLVLLIFVLFVAAVFVSSRVSSSGNIAPNAPESKPAAAGGCNKNPSLCRKDEKCVNGLCKKVPNTKTPTPTGYGTGYTCTSTNCPGPCFACDSAKKKCSARPNIAGCGGAK